MCVVWFILGLLFVERSGRSLPRWLVWGLLWRGSSRPPAAATAAASCCLDAPQLATSAHVCAEPAAILWYAKPPTTATGVLTLLLLSPLPLIP